MIYFTRLNQDTVLRVFEPRDQALSFSTSGGSREYRSTTYHSSVKCSLTGSEGIIRLSCYPFSEIDVETTALPDLYACSIQGISSESSSRRPGILQVIAQGEWPYSSLIIDPEGNPAALGIHRQRSMVSGHRIAKRGSS